MRVYDTEDVVGKVYHHWTVLSDAPRDKKKNRMVVAQCVCGKLKTLRLIHLRKEETHSCGCKNKRTTTHGLKKHPLYCVWVSMLTRCYNPKTLGWHNYGGKGVRVCDAWRDNFLTFYTWMTDHSWAKGLQIDRIDGGGDYSPENCRIVTPAENSRNKTGLLLSVELVKEIRRLHGSGELTPFQIGKKFGVRRNYVYDILNHKVWKNI